MSSRHVLVVEDNPDHRVLIGSVLRRFLPPTDVRLVDSAEAAIRYLHGMIPFDGPRLEPPTLLILDLDLPGMSGLQFLEWLRSQGDVQVPVVVFTLNTDPQCRARALELGAAGFHEKSEDFAVLAEIVLPYVRPEKREERHREEAG